MFNRILPAVLILAVLTACSSLTGPEATVSGGPDGTGGASGSSSGSTVLELGAVPEFTESFTTAAFTGLYYNNYNWVASIANMTGGCMASMDNLELLTTVPGDTGHGFIKMTVPANQMAGAEMKTFRKKDYHFGLYECRMKISPVPGVVNAFFWQGSDRSATGMEEIDIEFLTRESDGTSGTMRCTIHPKPDDQGHLDPLHQQFVDLDFSPGAAFHVYGFHWTSEQLTYYVDGEEVCTFIRSEGAVVPQTPGLIWLNTWTGTPSFGGGPPASDAHQIVDWVKYWPEGGSSGITVAD